MNENAKVKKIESFQGLRFFAIFAIFVSHVNSRLVAFGAWGVSIFLVLSGFLMAYNYLPRNNIKNNPLKFAIQKISGLYPLYIIMMMSAVVLYLPVWLSEFDASMNINLLCKIVLNILLLQSWVPNSDVYFSLNSVSWYFSLCFFLYLTFPFILNRMRRYKSTIQALWVCAVVVIAQVIISIFSSVYAPCDPTAWFSQRWMTYISPIYRLGEFIIGCNLGYIFLNNREKLIQKMNCIISSGIEVVAILALVVSIFLYYNCDFISSAESFKYSLVFLPTSIVIIFVLSFQSGIIAKFLSTKLLVWLGNLSPYIFLIHLMVIRYVNIILGQLIGDNVNNLVCGAIYIIVTLLAAFLWDCIVKKIKNSRDKNIDITKTV